MKDFPSAKNLLDRAAVGLIILGKDENRWFVRYQNSRVQSFFPGSTSAGILSQIENALPDLSGSFQCGDRWLRCRAEEMDDDHASLAVWIDDLSFHKQLEERLSRKVEEADKLSTLKTNFLATVSHEMRTPMQSIFGLLELMTLEDPSGRILEMIEIAKTSAIDLLEILDDLLDLAKMDADRLDLDAFEIPLRTLVRGVTEALAVRIGKRNVTLEDDIDDDVPAIVIGDPKRLRQILINLTANAIKFTSEGRVLVKVASQQPSKTGDAFRLRFEIIDTGIGISAEAQTRLFHRFSQADQTTSRKYGGTGLGLSICKELITLMDGTIGVTSTEGQGSTFWFEIPMLEYKDASVRNAMPDLSGLSVLSVEDHPSGAREIVNTLKSMGAAVENCPSISEATVLLKRRPFDVAIVDQGLPDGVGLDLVSSMQTLRPYMGIFMYTVRDDPGMRQSLESMGIRYVSKPASRLGLGQAVLEAALRSPRKAPLSSDILIVDDTEAIRDLLRRQTGILGCRADVVDSGAEALNLLKTRSYGLLLTDLHMPEIDGFHLVRYIRDHESIRRMPVILLTADVQLSQRQVYLEHGFDECLLKPITLGHLNRLLMRWGILPDDMQTDIFITSDQQPPIDLKALSGLTGNSDVSAKDFMTVFIDMTTPVLNELEHAFAQTDGKQKRDAAHSLKGAALSVGAQQLAELAGLIERETGHNEWNPALLDAVKAEFQRAEAFIHEWLNRA